MARKPPSPSDKTVMRVSWLTPTEGSTGHAPWRLRPPTPQTLSGHLAVAFHLFPDQLRLNRRQDRLAFSDAQPQCGGGDPFVPIEGRDVVLD
jgi:hypothetical protein